MTKRYLKTPEEVIDALQAGKKIEAGDFEYRLVGEVIIAINKTDKSWAVNAGIYSDDIPFIEEPEQLNLEVGKFYKTRDGKKAWIVSYKQWLRYPYYVAVLGDVGTYTVLGSGCCYENHPTHQDIVSPWEE